MTLKEIAKEAGVSISTVSRVINKNSTSAASKRFKKDFGKSSDEPDTFLTVQHAT